MLWRGLRTRLAQPSESGHISAPTSAAGSGSATTAASSSAQAPFEYRQGGTVRWPAFLGAVLRVSVALRSEGAQGVPGIALPPGVDFIAATVVSTDLGD